MTACRSFDEWDRHPQGSAIAKEPLFTIEKIGEGPRLSLDPAGERPLAGMKILDLTRIIAGPVCGRTLAAHGADVLLVTAAHLPAMLPLVIDTGRGKLSASVDLRDTGGRETLAALARDADVFVQGYRPGAIAGRGFGPQDIARLRPGIVYASLCAYGYAGPWAGRRGFDSLVQTASGLNDAEAQAFGSREPKALPAQVLDHATGYLLAFAVMAALVRRVEEGGSWHVRVSLAQTGSWFRRLGRIDGTAGADPDFADVRDCLEESVSGVRPAHRRAPCRGDVRNAATMGTPERAARHAPAGMAAVKRLARGVQREPCDAEREVDADLTGDRERLQRDRAMRPANQNFCTGAEPERRVGCRAAISSGESAVRDAGRRHNHAPNHDTTAPDANIKTNAVDGAGVIVGRPRRRPARSCI